MCSIIICNISAKNPDEAELDEALQNVVLFYFFYYCG